MFDFSLGSAHVLRFAVRRGVQQIRVAHGGHDDVELLAQLRPVLVVRGRLVAERGLLARQQDLLQHGIQRDLAPSRVDRRPPQQKRPVF